MISPIVRLSNRIEELFYSMSLEELLHAEEPQEAAIRARHNVSERHNVPAPHPVPAGNRPAEAAPQEQLIWK